MGIGEVYLTSVRATLDSWKEKGDKAIAQLNDDELQWAPNAESNSVAVIVKHVSGNMFSRWTDFLTTDGEKPTRHRDQEFEGGYPSKQALVDAWEAGWETFYDALAALEEADLLKTVYIRGERFSVVRAIEYQVAHYANHIGQILYIGKQLKSQDWACLSIPKGKSQQFLEEKLRRHQEEQARPDRVSTGELPTVRPEARCR